MFPGDSGVDRKGGSPDIDLADQSKVSLSFYGKKKARGWLNKQSLHRDCETGLGGDVLEAYSV